MLGESRQSQKIQQDRTTQPWQFGLRTRQVTAELQAKMMRRQAPVNHPHQCLPQAQSRTMIPGPHLILQTNPCRRPQQMIPK